MSKLKISKSGLLCTIVVFLQLLWMQTNVFFPGLGGPIYQVFYFMKYIGTFMIFVYAVSVPKKRRVLIHKREYMKLFIPLFILYFVVEFVALFSSPVLKVYGLSFVSRSLAYVLDKLCILIMVTSIWTLKREKSVDCVTNALLLDNILIILFAIPKIGVSGIIYTLGEAFGIANSPSSLLEVHELTYCIGLCLIYYLFFSRKKINIIRLLLLIFFFIIGGKRIGFAGILLSALFALFVRKNGIGRRTVFIVGLTCIIGCFGYITILYNGDFLKEMSLHKINVMGRDAIYSYFLARTKLSIDHLGWGLAGVSKMIENMSRAEVGSMVVVRGLHNDILRIYIDFGFFGSLLWFIYQLLYFPIQLFKRFGKKEATLYLALVIYAFVTYLTDNTENYFVFQTLLFLIPLTAGEVDLKFNILEKNKESEFNWMGKRVDQKINKNIGHFVLKDYERDEN